MPLQVSRRSGTRCGITVVRHLDDSLGERTGRLDRTDARAARGRLEIDQSPIVDRLQHGKQLDPLNAIACMERRVVVGIHESVEVNVPKPVAADPDYLGGTGRDASSGSDRCGL